MMRDYIDRQVTPPKLPTTTIPGFEIVVKSCSVKRNAKNSLVLGRAFFPAATAPFPKSRTSYFRSARFTDVTTILSESLVQATTKRLTSTT